MPSTATICYRFHPLHPGALDVVRWSRRTGSAVTLRDPEGKTLKIPLWMLEPEAMADQLTDQVELPVVVLRARNVEHDAASTRWPTAG